MNPAIELNLGLILFLPWYAILLVLYCRYPRAQGRGARHAFDAIALAIAIAATTFSLHWSMSLADPVFGGMWRQVLGTSVSYGVFLAIMTGAWFLRRRVLYSRTPETAA